MSTGTTDNTKIATFQVAVSDYAELEQLAQSRERTVSAELRLALKAYLADARKLTK